MTEATRALQHPGNVKAQPLSEKTVSRRRFETLEKFLAWRKPEDGYKYEWNNGIVEKSPKMITFENLYVADRLIRLFQKTKLYGEGGQLFTEPQAMTSSVQLRIPDMAFYDAQQIKAAANGIQPIPAFVIELISDNDTQKKILKKLEEYFDAGVRMVWHLVPALGLIYVYSSPTQVTICKKNIVASAEPVIPGFKISAEDLFAR